MLRYAWRDLVRNPRRTSAALAGVALGVALFAGVLLFGDASSATLTRRALAPLTLDIHRVLTSPLGRRLTFTQDLGVDGPLAAGDEVTVTLTVANETDDPAHEVVVNDEPPPPLSYVHGTTILDGEPLPDVAGQSPLAQGLARSGLNIGTVEPGRTVTFTYVAKANQTVPDVATLAPSARISSREDVVPLPANAPSVLSLDELQARVRRLPGVAAADGLAFVDLPPGSLEADGATHRSARPGVRLRCRLRAPSPFDPHDDRSVVARGRRCSASRPPAPSVCSPGTTSACGCPARANRWRSASGAWPTSRGRLPSSPAGSRRSWRTSSMCRTRWS